MIIAYKSITLLDSFSHMKSRDLWGRAEPQRENPIFLFYYEDIIIWKDAEMRVYVN